jgi:hypothetical protein
MKLKEQKLCPRWNISEGLFTRQTGIDLIYERTTIFDSGVSLDCIKHHGASIQQRVPPVGLTQG